MALEKSNSFALLGYGEDISKLIIHAVVKATPPVEEKKKQQRQDMKKEQTALSPEMLRAKPIVLPDHISRRDLVLRKPRAKGEGQAYGYLRSYGTRNGYDYRENNGVSTGSQGSNKGRKGNKRNTGDSTAKPVDEDGWQVCTRGSRGGGRMVFNDYNESGHESQATVGTQQIEEKVQYVVKKSGEGGAKSKQMKLKAQENPENKAEERTLEYERVLLDKKFETQQIAEKKKVERLSSKQKSKKDKPKKKDENKEKVGKPLSPNVVNTPVKKNSKDRRRSGFFKSKLGKGIIWVSAFAFLFSIMLDEIRSYL